MSMSFDFILFLSIRLLERECCPQISLADVGISSLAFWPPVWRADPVLFVMGAIREAFQSEGENGTHSTVKDFYEGQVVLARTKARMTWLLEGMPQPL